MGKIPNIATGLGLLTLFCIGVAASIFGLYKAGAVVMGIGGLLMGTAVGIARGIE